MEASKELPSEMQSLVQDTTVSKKAMSYITENMSNIEKDGKVGDMKKYQECLSPTTLWKSSTGSHDHQEVEKDHGDPPQAIKKSSEVSPQYTDLQNFVYRISGQHK
jgi:hypothetical protein